MTIKPYGVAMAQAAASGDLERMRQAARDAEEHLREYGNVPAALEVLRAEIARLERQQAGGQYQT